MDPLNIEALRKGATKVKATTAQGSSSRLTKIRLVQCLCSLSESAPKAEWFWLFRQRLGLLPQKRTNRCKQRWGILIYPRSVATERASTPSDQLEGAEAKVCAFDN